MQAPGLIGAKLKKVGATKTFVIDQVSVIPVHQLRLRAQGPVRSDLHQEVVRPAGQGRPRRGAAHHGQDRLQGVRILPGSA